MSESEGKSENFIQDRLDALSSIDGSIVLLLKSFSSLFQTYSNSKTDQNPTRYQDDITENTKNIYKNISDVAISLRKEVKLLDENIGVFGKNKSNIMILPIAVDQKNTKLGKKKMDYEVEQLDKLMEKDSKYQESTKENADVTEGAEKDQQENEADAVKKEDNYE